MSFLHLSDCFVSTRDGEDNRVSTHIRVCCLKKNIPPNIWRFIFLRFKDAAQTVGSILTLETSIDAVLRELDPFLEIDNNA